MKHIVSFSGGKDSTAMLLMMIEKDMKIDDIVFFDTGWEFPQMIDHIDKVEKYIKRKIIRLYPKMSFEYWMIKRPIKARSGEMKGQNHRIGNGWPSPLRRWCTREKVSTIDKYCGTATRYIGIAADESHRMMSASLISPKYIKIFPLCEWGIDEPLALQYCKNLGFDWGGLYDYFPRVSCFCCPLQRIDSLRVLRKNFPELWRKMLDWDRQIDNNNKKYKFKEYDTVCDLEERFRLECLQKKFNF